MRKLYRLFFIAAALCMLLSACSPAASNPSTSTPPSSGSVSNAPASTAPSADAPSVAPPSELEDMSSDVIDADLTATISLGNWPADTAPAAELSLWEGYREIMSKQYPNVTVVPQYYSYTLSNYVPMAKGGTAPTVFQPPFTDPQLLINQGLVADVTDALKEFGLLDKFSPSFLSLLGDENGRIFGMPRDGWVMGMHINIDLFEQAGLMTDDGLPMYPKTLQELAEYGKIIREKTGKAGLAFPASETYGGWLFTNIAWNFGAVGDDALTRQEADGRWVCNLSSDAAVAALQYIKSLRWEYDILNADATTTDWAGVHSILGTGEAAMSFNADDCVDQPTAGKGLPVESFALVPFPSGPGGSYAMTGGTCFMFAPNTTTDQAVAALGFIRLTGMLPFLDDDIIAGMRSDAAAKRERGAPVLPRVPAWNADDYVSMQRKIAEEYSNVNWDIYNAFFDSFSNGSMIIKGEEPIFAQQLYRDLTSAIQRIITREDADVRRALEQAQERFQEYLDEEANS